MTRQPANPTTAVPRLRYTHAEAAAVLGIGVQYLYELADRGDLVPTTNQGRRGGGKRLYYDPAEVEAFARGGAPAAAAYRAGRDGAAKGKAGRGRRARA